jgi:hypothetical protein
MDDGFVAQLDANGTCLWAVSFGGPHNDRASDVSCDGGGNVYACGTFQGQGSFGTDSLISAGSTDICVLKLDLFGNWQWARRAGSAEMDSGEGICVSYGGVYISGGFKGQADFGEDILTSAGMTDIFIARVELDGSWTWCRRAGSANTGDFIFEKGMGLCPGPNQSVCMTGQYMTGADFGPVTLLTSQALDADVFVSCLSSSGDWIWTTRGGGINTDSAYDICMDYEGDLWICGCFYDGCQYGNLVVLSEGHTDAFMASCDASGTWIDLRRAGGTYIDTAYSVCADASANIWITGRYMDSANFGHQTLSVVGGTDAWVSKLGIVSPVDDPQQMPQPGIHLTVAPNPFHATLNLRLEMIQSQSLSLSVYDLRGRLITCIHAGILSSGYHDFGWAPPKDLPAGIYLAKARSGNRTVLLRLCHLK